MAKKTTIVELDTQTPVKVDPPASVGQTELANALIAAINATKAVEKKTPFNRTKNTPWTPKDGSPRLKLKRTMYQHGILIGSRVSNEEIALLNQIKPGRFCDGHVHVVKRKDKGLNIDYPVKTASQRLKLVNQFGLRNFVELLQRLVDEAKNPSAYKTEEDE